MEQEELIERKGAADKVTGREQRFFHIHINERFAIKVSV